MSDRRRPIRLALLTAATLAIVPHAPAAPPSATPQGPALWRISDGDSRVYLFGTLHLLPEGVTWKTPAYEAAMADAETTVVEADVESRYARATMASLVAERGLNSSAESLRDIIGQKRFDALAAIAKRYGMSPDRLSRMRPWLAMMSVSLAALDQAGMRRSRGVERTILADADAAHDKRNYLETAEAQIKALASLDDGPDMLANVDLELEQLAKFEETIDPMVDAWRKGDVATLERISSADTRRVAPRAHRVILVDRNRNWIPRIEGWLAAKHDYFVACGTAHLVGPDSVIAMLEKKGYKVERIQ